jgi:predicted small metal-binding protein
MAITDRSAQRPMRPGWQITCAETCGFMVRDYDQDELVKVIQLHLATSHGQQIRPADALRMATAVAEEI